MKRSSLLFGLLILLLTMGACGNPSLQNNSQAQASSSPMQSSTAKEPQSSSAAPSSENAVNIRSNLARIFIFFSTNNPSFFVLYCEMQE